MVQRPRKMQGKVRMLELTMYGLMGLAAMLVIAFGFAYADEFSPAREQSSFELINIAHMNDSPIIETERSRLHGAFGKQQEASPVSLRQIISPSETGLGAIYIDAFQRDRGQVKVFHG
jgi:hypothetical protein